MPLERIRIASRKSPLALWQADYIARLLQKNDPHLEIDIVPVVTTGDRFLKDKLQVIGGKGAFVKELETAMLEGKADIAVHSMKDVPVLFPKGLMLGAICKRHNPFDALVSQHYPSIDALPHEAVVGTVSLRRQTQLHMIRKDLEIKPLRGNIHTRIQKMQAGEYDAIVLAASGLERMGLLTQDMQQFTADEMLPACGQGALGIECRLGDGEVLSHIEALNDELTATCVELERRVSQLLGGNCHTPLAVYCSPQGEENLMLRARVVSKDGHAKVEDTQLGAREHASCLADQVVDRLKAQGVERMLAEME